MRLRSCGQVAGDRCSPTSPRTRRSRLRSPGNRTPRETCRPKSPTSVIGTKITSGSFDSDLIAQALNASDVPEHDIVLVSQISDSRSGSERHRLSNSSTNQRPPLSLLGVQTARLHERFPRRRESIPGKVRCHYPGSSLSRGPLQSGGESGPLCSNPCPGSPESHILCRSPVPSTESPARWKSRPGPGLTVAAAWYCPKPAKPPFIRNESSRRQEIVSPCQIPQGESLRCRPRHRFDPIRFEVIRNALVEGHGRDGIGAEAKRLFHQHQDPARLFLCHLRPEQEDRGPVLQPASPPRFAGGDRTQGNRYVRSREAG